MSSGRPIRLGLSENAGQFSLLVLVNALVGAMIGMERSIVPVMAECEFHLAASSAILSFILVFGLAKAVANYFVGRLADRRGRKAWLVAGWIAALPVPFVLMWATEWRWILLANVLLGISQGFAWSMTVLMKTDLVGPARRGLAMGLNEFAGYVAVAAAAWATGWIAATYGLRPQPFYLGVAVVLAGLGLSLFLVHDTRAHVQLETTADERTAPAPADIFWRTTVADPNLSSITQRGWSTT